MKRNTAGQRVAVSLIALILLAAGALGLALSLGAFGADRSSGPVLPDQTRSFANDQPWFWWALAAGCLLLALLGLRWLLSQVRTEGVGRLDLTSDTQDGVTTLHAGALTAAVEDEARTLTGVTAASARMRERNGRHLDLRVDLADHADISAVRDGLEQRVVAHARQAVGDPGLKVDVELRPTSRTDTRFR